MRKLKSILYLIRCKHYLKNMLIFVPLFFGEKFLDASRMYSAAIGFLAFCMASSFIYIVNDISDVERDRKHPVKCKRPIASGEISVRMAWTVAVLCLLLSVVFSLPKETFQHYWIVALYIILNVLYSRKLKNIPLVDVAILVSGFVIRIAYGGLLSDIPISNWLYLTIIAGAFYLGLGKRRNELQKYAEDDTRVVLSHYNYNFLDKNMYMCMGLANAFYALWAIENAHSMMIWTVPLVLLITMKYSLAVEGTADADPIEVILKDKFILACGGIYAIVLMIILYL
ncbi:MAG: UbiA prenyltransferase family protein [Lachnoclostridium sp.]|nr:UbiA prenyltransferase family protein [Lachnoclostridium sp.]MCM1385670.1 UbiA prenyltransferase family protein [Lachnoclostridium sp.]